MKRGWYLLALSGNLIAQDNMIQLLPGGLVDSKKGKFVVDEVAIQQILNSCQSRKNEIVIDYEHQTLNGTEAPAAGWIKRIENRGKDGLWAEVEWTSRAAQYIANKEYRYLSPVVLVRKSDQRAVALHSAALTNDPAIDGMVPIANKFEIDQEGEFDNMDFLKRLAAMLGLSETATEEQILNKLEEIKNATAVVANKDVLGLLDLGDAASLEDVKGKIIALKNPAGYVKTEEFNKLKEKLELRDRDELVTMALKQGKITPAQKDWADLYALKDPAGFKNFVEKAPQVVPLEEVITGGGSKITVNDETQLHVNKLLGLSQEDYTKANKEE